MHQFQLELLFYKNYICACAAAGCVKCRLNDLSEHRARRWDDLNEAVLWWINFYEELSGSFNLKALKPYLKVLHTYCQAGGGPYLNEYVIKRLSRVGLSVEIESVPDLETDIVYLTMDDLKEI